MYLLLFGASVPWYLPEDTPIQIWFGLPQWVVISLLATIGVRSSPHSSYAASGPTRSLQSDEPVAHITWRLRNGLIMTGSLGGGAVLAVGLYLAAILAVGYAARRQRGKESLAEFYLAGRQLTGPVLLLTLYATQYSGNTLIGYPGEAFRLGFSWS